MDVRHLLRFYRALYIYTTRIRFIMVIGLSGVQLTGWMNAKRESDWSIKTMTKFEFDRLYTFINQKKKTTTTGPS